MAGDETVVGAVAGEEVFEQLSRGQAAKWCQVVQLRIKRG